MQLSSILLTRVIAICGLGETNPFGKVFLPSLLPELVKRYSFQKHPDNLTELNLADGVKFELGYAEECGTISKLTIYSDGMTIETQNHSSASKAALLGIFKWANGFGLNYREESVKRWLFVTSLLFHSDADLDLLHPITREISQAMRAYAGSIGRPETEFKTTRLAIDYDHSTLEFPHAAFVLERDKMARFEENKFFSESPMPSELHIELLERIEKSLLQTER